MRMMNSSENISFIIGRAYTFREDGKDQPVYAWIEQLVRGKAEEYNSGFDLFGISINIYLLEDYVDDENIMGFPTDVELASLVWDNINCQNDCVSAKAVINLKKSKRRYSDYIKALKPSKRPMQPFIVADTETTLVNDVHVPYAVGFMVVRPEDKLPPSIEENRIETYFSEDCPAIVFKTFERRSKEMMNNFIERLTVVVRHDPSIKIDIHLLGGVMQNAQELFWSKFHVDIVSKITLSSLALAIFRTCFYDEENWPIYIPNRNANSFICKGYYGGHADVYKPYGENLFYYDVNSLYPIIMMSYLMPAGKPVWHSNLQGRDINNLFGFIEAYVECPTTINKPFLPYRDKKNNTLIFPMGKFVGVYYSEELKFAIKEGYNTCRSLAVQLAAAVTACARIHMYPFISKADSYYTDTDSVVLGNPLPDNVISQTELDYAGKEKKILEEVMRLNKELLKESLSLKARLMSNIDSNQGATNEDKSEPRSNNEDKSEPQKKKKKKKESLSQKDSLISNIDSKHAINNDDKSDPPNEHKSDPPSE
ncbi:hypothetical protein V6N11_016327 [Hibiscus sabdariffa]|uniref:DNA-directed DNA polymerase n=1 Tax=Hibiscus sabdariffa TaxID=183260 RepID=A0ABR2TUU8_9ROSI